MSANRRATSRVRSVSARRAAYSLAAGAAAGLVQQVDAAVVYSGIENFNIDRRNELPLSLDGNGLSDIYLKNFVYTGKAGYFQGALVRFAPGRLVAKRVNDLNYVKALGAGFLVNSASVHPDAFVGTMAQGALAPNAEFNNVQNAYIGFSFAYFPDSPPPPVEERSIRYGWARVSINNAIGSFVVHDWAYESDFNVGIRTGDMGDAGDFNDDGVVDAADYTVWRDNLGTNHILAGHGDENGNSLNVVDQDDYKIWKANFGHVHESPSPGSGAATPAVPEPCTLGLLAAGALGVALLRHRRERT